MHPQAVLTILALSAWDRKSYSVLTGGVSAAVDSDFATSTDNVSVSVSVTFYTTPQSLLRAWHVCTYNRGRMLSSYIHEYPSYLQQQFGHMMFQPEFLTHVAGNYFWVGLRDSLMSSLYYEDGRSSVHDATCEGTITLINGIDKKTVSCHEPHMFACETTQGNLCSYETYPNAILVTEPGQMNAISEEECRFACDSSVDCWAYGLCVTGVPVCETYTSVPQSNITLKHMNECSGFVKTCVEGHIEFNGSDIQIRSHSVHWLNSSVDSTVQTDKFPSQETSLRHVVESKSSILFITASYEYEPIPPSSHLRVIPDYTSSLESDSATRVLEYETLSPSSFLPPSSEKESILPFTMNNGLSPSSHTGQISDTKSGISNAYITPTLSSQDNPSCNHRSSIHPNDGVIPSTARSTLSVEDVDIQNGRYSSVPVNVGLHHSSLPSTSGLESTSHPANSLGFTPASLLGATLYDPRSSRSSQIPSGPVGVMSTEAFFPEKSLMTWKYVKTTSAEAPVLATSQLASYARRQNSSESRGSFNLHTHETSLGLLSETDTYIHLVSTYEGFEQSGISLTPVVYDFGMSSSLSLDPHTSHAHTIQSSTVSLCPCPCTQPEAPTSSLTKEEKSAMVNKIIQSLTVNKTKIGATRRKYVSVVDDRPFSRSAGSIGIAILVFVFLSILMLDLVSVVQIVTPFRPVEHYE